MARLPRPLRVLSQAAPARPSPHAAAPGAHRTGGATAPDVVRRRAAVGERLLRESEEQFRLAFETAPAGMAVVGLGAGLRGRLLQVNDAFCGFTGRRRAELLEARMADVLHPADAGAHEVALLRAAEHAAAEPSGVERRFVAADGRVRWGRTATSLIRPRGGAAPRLLVVVEDVSAAREAQRALTHAALHDPLTGLPNRTLLGQRLARVTAGGERGVERVSVLFVDLDGFKAVNDTHGHAAGDALLREVAARLAGSVREGDTVARWGGDEFAVVCPGLHGAAAGALVGRVGRALATSVALPGGRAVAVTASVGVATAALGEDPHHLLDRADRSMYRAKARRRAGGGREPAPADGSSVPAPAAPVAEPWHAALERRVVVEQAKGYLAARLGTTVSEASELLRATAARRGVLVQELARSLVEGRADSAVLAP